MAAVSIIDVEVRDEAFKRLKDQFDLFQTAVKQQPAAWSAVSGQAHNVQVAIAGTATTMAGLSTGQAKVAKQAVGIAKTFQGIADDSTKLAKNVAGITRDLVRWVGFGAIFTGLLGGGGLFGLNRMATDVTSTRRTALGSGIGYGQAKAFDISYNRYGLDLDTVHRVADARSDQNKWVAFQALGIGNEERNNTDPAQLTIKMMKRARDEYNRSNGNKNYLEARHVTDMFSMDQLRNFSKASDADLDKSEGQFNRDAKKFDQDKPTQDAWETFVSALKGAGETVNTVLVKGLTSLTGPIGDLSNSFAKAVETFLSNDHLKDWIKQFGDAIERAAVYIGTDKFQKNVTGFVDGVAAMITALGDAVSWFGRTFGSNGDKTPGAKGGDVQNDGQKTSWMTRLRPDLIPETATTAAAKTAPGLIPAVAMDIPPEGRAFLGVVQKVPFPGNTGNR